MTQSDLAKLADTTNATISNMESGRSRQVRKILYARIVRVLFGTAPREDDLDAVHREIIEELSHLTLGNARLALDMVRALATRK